MLLAPNGKPSNLNAEQYKLVRTPTFKKWFGDWEKLEFVKLKDSAMDEITLQNLSKDVSKVVDENGEPLLCYHGTKHQFTIFKDTDVERNTMGNSVGMYFTSSELGASRMDWQGNYIKVFLNIKNLVSLKKFTNDDFWFELLGNNLKKARGLPDRAESYWFLKNGSGYRGLETDNVGDVVKELTLKKGIDGYLFPERMFNDIPEIDVYVCFNSNQIKLADGSNTTFDGSNPDIRYAKGGKIKTALKDVESAGSVKYWMQPEFHSETYDYEQKGKPNSFVKLYDEKHNADSIIAYDKKGNLVGLFTISKAGKEQGAFKIVVREDSLNKGWGKKLLDEAEKQGINIVGNIKNNKFSHSGRNLLRSWLTKKMEQGGALEFYERTYADGRKQKFTIEEYADIEKNRELAMGIKAEMEHKDTIDKFKRAGVSDKDVARSIAQDHLKEDPKYYTKLMNMENKMEEGGNVIKPIRELGTGAKVYFETSKYRVNDSYNTGEYLLNVGMKDSDGVYNYHYDNLEIPIFVAKEFAKIYPNGVPDALLVDKVVDDLEKKFELDEETDDIEIVQTEPEHHGISTNVKDYKNPYQVNRAIEKLLNAKGSEQENYTPDEINFISYYSGYGGLEKQGKGEFSEDELKGLLYEYFTPDEIVQKMWGLAYKYGYGAIGDNSVFEPSVGIGAFLKYAPNNVFVAANEINRYSAMICHILYPNAETTLMSFEKNFISRNLSIKKNVEGLKKYSLVIGNPPYGKLGGIYIPMGEDTYVGAANWVEYFIFRGLDLLQKGGLLLYVVGAEQYAGGTLFLDSELTKTKKAIFDKADLIDAYRLPNKLFERTGVSTEIVIFRKR